MKRCFVLARVRSGTTVLARMLESHPEVCHFGESLNEDNRNGFFDYLEKRVAENPALCRPSHRVPVFHDYLDHCCAHADDDLSVGVFDLKYETFHLVYRHWQGAGQVPDILRTLVSKGDSVIHLVRRNHLRRMISEYRANASGVYHLAGNRQEPGFDGMYIDPPGLLAQCEALDADYLKVQNHFLPRGGFLQVEYERMFEDGDGARFSDRFAADLATFLGVDDRFSRDTRLRRFSRPPLSTLIHNYDAVAEALRGSRWTYLLEDDGASADGSD